MNWETVIATLKAHFESTSGGDMVRSQLPAPKGLLTIQTGWKILDDGMRYVTTIHFLSPRG